VLVFVAIFSLIQGRLVRDKTYFYYALYLLTIAFYFSRNYERAFDYPILCLKYPILYDLSEIYCNCASYLLYILFFRQFLDLPRLLPKVDKLLRGIFWVIIGLVFINIFINVFISMKAGLWFFDRVRIVFFAFVICYFYVLITLKGDRMTRLLGFGFLAIILPAVISVFENLTGSVLTEMYWGTWRHYDLGNWHYEFYDMEVGILIEIACFSTALYYKTKAERRKNAEIQQRLISLVNEHEALKQQNEQAEKDRFDLAEKEAALKRQINTLKNNVIEKTENTDENAFILRGGKIIEDNLQNPLFSVEDFAKAMDVERGKFYPEWKHATGQTPNESIKNARLAAVQRLLLTTDLTISEIAHQTGFNEAAYLSRVFQAKFGQSPKDFRRK
jgi:AraC-like DNA-binding protein